MLLTCGQKLGYSTKLWQIMLSPVPAGDDRTARLWALAGCRPEWVWRVMSVCLCVLVSKYVKVVACCSGLMPGQSSSASIACAAAVVAVHALRHGAVSRYAEFVKQFKQLAEASWGSEDNPLLDQVQASLRLSLRTSGPCSSHWLGGFSLPMLGWGHCAGNRSPIGSVSFPITCPGQNRAKHAVALCRGVALVLKIDKLPGRI